MRVFISWSGERSLQVAKALHGWLPRVLQAVEPYLSVEDTAKGAYWAAEVKHQLDAASFGIICLTPDNLEAKWIHFEAGALSKSFERGNVAPFLFGVAQDALTGPLTQFQVTEACKPADVLRLVKDLNKACGDRAVGEQVAEDSFQVWWSHLEDALDQVTAPPVIGQRPTDDMVREILDRQRTLERFLSDSAGLFSFQYMEALVRQAAHLPGPELRAELENLLGQLALALDACADSADPSVKEAARHVAAVRELCEKMAGRQLQWEPLRILANAKRRRLTTGDA